MLKQALSRGGSAVAVVIATLNVEKVVQASSADSWLGGLIAHGPAWLDLAYRAVLDKWVLFIVGVYIGVAVNNWLTGLHGRLTMAHGSVPLWWVRRRMSLVRRAIGNRSLAAIADLARNLAALDRELASPGVRLPPLPSTDPHDQPGMRHTAAYLESVLPFMRRGRLDHARKLASTVVDHWVP